MWFPQIQIGTQGSKCGQFRRLQITFQTKTCQVFLKKSVLAILHTRVSFYLHVEEDFKGMEKLFSVMNVHWLTNIHTVPFPPETSNSFNWTHVDRHYGRQTSGIVLSFITSVCLPRLLAKNASRCIASVNLQFKFHLWFLHETPPQFLNSWAACSRNERREYTHMRDLRWSWPHQEFLVSKTVFVDPSGCTVQDVCPKPLDSGIAISHPALETDVRFYRLCCNT
jgi:hypothetical protein